MVYAENAEEAAKLFKFSTFCGLLDQIRKIPKVAAGNSKYFKQRSVRQVLAKWKSLFPPDVVPNYFPLLRLFANHYDTRKYHFKIKRLIQKVCKALILPDNTRIHLLALAEKSTSTKSVIEQIVKEIAIRNTEANSELTLFELNESLDKVTDAELSEAEIRTLLKGCSSESEIFWILQIFLRKVEDSLMVSSATIINCIHPHASQLRVAGTPLERICELAAENKLRDEGSLLFRPFEPMLLARVKSGSSDNSINVYDKLVRYCGVPFYMQLKFDGEHFLLHRKSDGEYRFFSRNQIDHTEKIGRFLNSKLDQCFAPFVKDCIFDGELLLWDVFEKKFVGKSSRASDGRIYDVKSLRDEGACIPCMAVFDLLFLNGRTLLDVPLSERLELLRTVFKKQDNSIIFIGEFKVAKSREDFAKFFEEAMRAHEEGVVVKRMDSLYKIGVRMMSNGCFKVKPFHLGTETLDVAVVGVDRAGDGHIQSYTVGVLREGKYSIVGKIGAGLDYNGKEQLRHHLTKDFGFLKGDTVPDWIHEDYSRNDLPTDYVHRRNIQVLEIKAKGVLNNRLYAPVIKFHRIDKPVKDIDTYETFLDFDETLRNQSIAEAGSEVPSQRKRAGAVPQVMEDYRLTKRVKVENLSLEFEGLQFCVLRGSPDVSVQELRDIIVSFGGKCFANPTKNTQYVITGEPNHLKTKSAIKSNACNVIHAQWLVDCKKASAVVPLKKVHILHAVNDELISKFSSASLEDTLVNDGEIDDEREASPQEPMDAEEVRSSGNSKDEKWSEGWIKSMLNTPLKVQDVDKKEIEGLRGLLLPDDRFHHFGQKCFFLHSSLKNAVKKYLKLLILIHGGIVSEKLSDSAYICTQKRSLTRVAEELCGDQQVVDLEWILKEVKL